MGAPYDAVMGASGWITFVPYDADIDTALTTARHATFRAGSYYSPPTKTELELRRERKGLVAELEKLRKDTQHDPADRETFIAITEGQIGEIDHELTVRKSPPTDIDDQIRALMRRCAEDGTGSVLDITTVSDKPRFGAAAPLDDEALTALFGTTEPTKSVVESTPFDCRRGQAWYVIVFHDGEPTEICFTGVTGD